MFSKRRFFCLLPNNVLVCADPLLYILERRGKFGKRYSRGCGVHSKDHSRYGNPGGGKTRFWFQSTTIIGYFILSSTL